ncbi:hypothetical protein Tco_0992885 [Tanacetum coccineum]|uniref:Uncharacterized protein n=1 Tax=Tanacetum coccineum TaxID=301880 RepID=A0ABQ5F3D1_9ASTR
MMQRLAFFEEEKRNIASQKRATQATSFNKLSTGRSSVSTTTTPYVSAASTPTGANAAYDDENRVQWADFYNIHYVEDSIIVCPHSLLRIHKDHPKDQILGDPKSAIQTRGKIQKASSAQQALEEDKSSKLSKIPTDMSMGRLLGSHKWTRTKKLRSLEATTPIESNKPLVKDEDGEDVDVHAYISMIGSLMYLTASRPDIMFDVCACARFQVTLKASHLNAVKMIFRSEYGGGQACLDKKSIIEYVAAANYYGQANLVLPRIKVGAARQKFVLLVIVTTVDECSKCLWEAGSKICREINIRVKIINEYLVRVNQTANKPTSWCLYDDGDDEDGGGDVAAGWGGDVVVVVVAETAGGGKARGGECGSGLGRSEEEEHIWCSAENPPEKFSGGGVVAMAGIRRRGWFPAAGNPGEGERDNERFYTSVGNPVKEILLKLNLPDHRILKDGGEDTGESVISTALGAAATGTIATVIVGGLKYSSNKGWNKVSQSSLFGRLQGC